MHTLPTDNNVIHKSLEPCTTIILKLQKVLLETLNFNEVVKKIVDELLNEAGFKDLGYRIIVLTLVNEEKGVLERISLSSTPEAAKTLEASAVPFHNIDIPLNAKENLLIQCLTDQQPHLTHSWPELFTPVLTPEQAKANQRAAGIETSVVHPIVVNSKALGVLIFSLVKNIDAVSEKEQQVLYSFSNIVGIAVQNSRLFTSLKQANIQIGLAGKLKENLLTMASHEFRTPISNIKNMLWMFESQEFLQKLSDKEKQHFARLSKSVERLDYVVNNISQMLRATTGDFEQQLQFDAVQIERIVHQVIEDKDVEARDALVTLKYIEPDNLLPVIEADPIKLQYVIYELITNALKYTSKNGTVTVSTTLENNDIVIKIADTGRGIPADNLPTLFQGFDKIDVAHTTQSGMGLGLYIVQKIVTLHKGTISVDSVVDRGTTITIKLPAQKTEYLV